MRKTIQPVLAAACCLAAGTAPAANLDLQAVRDRLVQHEAHYEMRLDYVAPNSEVVAVDGRSAYRLEDQCSGWSSTEDYVLRFIYNTGDEITIASHYQAWEQIDGQLFNFELHEESSYEPTLKFEGFAALTEANAGEAYFSMQSDQAMPIPSDTLFPMAHLEELLMRAEKGDKFFSANIFSGAEPDRALKKATAFISDLKTRDAALLDNELIARDYWPVRIAYFDPSSDNPEPDYEVVLELQANGLVAGYQIDYGDLVIRADLQELSSQPAADCQT